MRIRHGRIWLELHEIARREGPSLLLLHQLYGSSADWRDVSATWPGSLYALDLSGHGESEWLIGGAYYPELITADADLALTAIEPTAIVGAGIGAYAALLLAGARSTLVSAALLLPGSGLAGAGDTPHFEDAKERFDRLTLDSAPRNGCDPMVQVLDQDVRPVHYVKPFAEAAHKILLQDDGGPRPPWWEAIRATPNVESVRGDLEQLLERLAAVVASRA
jgi:pimeloyl-ACP methyl ester carboxylesterase